MNNMKYVFLGTDNFSVNVLDQLKISGFLPSLIITVPDRKSGRGQKIQSPLIKSWASINDVPILQPEKLDTDAEQQIKSIIPDSKLFIVASYGKIIPKIILDIPQKGTLNVHPSLLPKYRGASPIETAILNDDKKTGVTIMLMDEKMDHGPIITQESHDFAEWPMKTLAEKDLAIQGGKLLSEAINPWILGEITAKEQSHDKASYTQKITKEDGRVDFEIIKNIICLSGENKSRADYAEERKLFLKIQALNPWPGVYFTINHLGKEIRVKIIDADWVDNKIIIKNLRPEGRNSTDLKSFISGYLK